MNMKIIQSIFTISMLFCISCSSASVENKAAETEKTKPISIDSILENLNKMTQELQSYQCQLEYRHVQPSVFDTQSLRKGVLYYSKQEGASKLRVNFQTLKQDEEAEQKYNEQYIVVPKSDLERLYNSSIKDKTKKINLDEGIWLVHMDYEFKTPKFIQIAEAGEPNKSTDVFDLISKNLPMVGFTKADKLREQFDITIVTQDSNNPPQTSGEKPQAASDEIIQLHLKVKSTSVYKDDYVQIDCWIDTKLNLPVKLVAVSTEPAGQETAQKDFYEVKFVNAKINEKIDPKIFDFQIPDGFDEPEIYPLKNGG